MLKIVALVKKRDDMTWDEFVDYWENDHTEPIDGLSNLKRYTIAPAIDPENAPYDGVANLYFETTDDIGEAFTEERMAEIRADEEQFVDDVETFVVSEQTQIDNT
jgi:uncharacterized protein (TIGR02118 family)